MHVCIYQLQLSSVIIRNVSTDSIWYNKFLHVWLHWSEIRNSTVQGTRKMLCLFLECCHVTSAGQGHIHWAARVQSPWQWTRVRVKLYPNSPACRYTRPDPDPRQRLSLANVPRHLGKHNQCHITARLGCRGGVVFLTWTKTRRRVKLQSTQDLTE